MGTVIVLTKESGVACTEDKGVVLGSGSCSSEAGMLKADTRFWGDHEEDVNEWVEQIKVAINAKDFNRAAVIMDRLDDLKNSLSIQANLEA